MKPFISNEELPKNQMTVSLDDLKGFIQTLTLNQLNDIELLTDKPLGWIANHIHCLAIDEKSDLGQLLTVEDKSYPLITFIIRLISCHVNQPEYQYDFPTYIDFLLKYNLTESESYKNFTAWNFLCFSNPMKKLMIQLLDKGYLPDAETLNAIILQGPHSGMTGWFALAVDDTGHSIFQRLLNEGVYPSAQALDSICTEGLHKGLSAWFWLAMESNRSILEQLLNHEIYPSVQAMNSICDQGPQTGKTPWYWLVMKDTGLSLIQQLGDKEIYPNAEAMNSICGQGPSTGLTAWHWLTGNQVGRLLLQRLLNKNIYPSAQAMNSICAQGPNSGMVAWFGLIDNDKGRSLLQQMLDKEIYPSAQALDSICAQTGLTIWHLLTGDYAGRPLLRQLWDKEIYPSAQALDSICSQGDDEGSTPWYWLALHDTDHYLIQRLFNKGIYPSANALNSIRSQGPYAGITAWYWLADDTGHSLIQQLLDKGIYPDMDSFSTVIEDHSTWDKLIKSPIICTFIAQNIRLPDDHLTPLLTQGYQLVERFKKSDCSNQPQVLEEMYQASLTWVMTCQIQGVFKETDAALVIFWHHLGINHDNYHKALMNFTSVDKPHFQHLWNRAAKTFLKNSRWQYLLDTLPYLTSTMRYEKFSLALLAQIDSISDKDLKQIYLKAGLLLSLQVENKEARLYCLKRVILALVEDKPGEFNYVAPASVDNLINHLNNLSLAERQHYKNFSDGLFYQIEQLKLIIQQQSQLTILSSQLTEMTQKMEQLCLMMNNKINSENILPTADCDKPILNSFKNNSNTQQEENYTPKPELKN